MFCEKCGTRNAKKAKYCGSCGNKLTNNEKEQILENGSFQSLKLKIVNLPKKTKAIMMVVFFIIIIAVIILGILLNNPVKKIEDTLERYYVNSKEDKKIELIKIGEILKDNKENQIVLKDIKKTTQKAMEKWVKNFNTEYKNNDDLKNAYLKVSGALKDIYNYFNGLEYMLDYDLYQSYNLELSNLYDSKKAYFNAIKEDEKNNDYYAYYYYQKVIEEDNYYKKAQEYINNYVKEEFVNFKKEVMKFVNITDESTNQEILDCYIKQIKYLSDNKISNNIDLSITEEYKNLYKTAVSKIAKYTKKLVEDLEKDSDYNKILEKIEKSLDILPIDSIEYKDLMTLKKIYQNKIPDNLLTKYLVSSTLGSGETKYKKVINGVLYDSNIFFRFEGEKQSRVYRLDGEYKKFVTKIVRGSDWNKDFSGYFVIMGDDKELYKSDVITKNSDIQVDIQIDVSKVNDLKIEFVTKSKDSLQDNFYIYLVEPYLYK